MSEQQLESLAEKPLVCIALATYNPNFIWFAEQLESLNNQTYENLKLLVLDDCSEHENFQKITNYLERYITRFPYEIYRNEENLGSNKTFERLTELAEGEYIAYCDQDDVWLAEKLEKLVALIQEAKSTLVCSDVFIIDDQGKIKADSITQVRKRHIFKSGENLASQLLFRNFVIGCTMLMPTEIAKAAIPFVTDMVHDHYLALFAATKGGISVSPQNLVKYRIHGNNQTNVLTGVKTKKDYYEVRILPYLRRMEQLKDRFDREGIALATLAEACEWAKARDGYYHRVKGCGWVMWGIRHLNITTTVFELVMFRMPESLFGLALGLIQRGKI